MEICQNKRYEDKIECYLSILLHQIVQIFEPVDIYEWPHNKKCVGTKSADFCGDFWTSLLIRTLFHFQQAITHPVRGNICETRLKKEWWIIS